MKIFAKIKVGLITFLRFFILPQNASKKHRIITYSIYFLFVIILNILLGKNLTHRDFPFYTNVLMVALLNFNIVLLLVLLVLIFRNLVKILVEWSWGIRAKLVIFSILITAIPTFILFLVSKEFLSTELLQWSSKQIDGILSGSHSIIKATNKLEEERFQKNLMMASKILERDILSRNLSPREKSRIFERNICFYVTEGVFLNLLLFDYNGNIIYACQNISFFNFLQDILNKRIDYIKKNSSSFNNHIVSKATEEIYTSVFWGTRYFYKYKLGIIATQVADSRLQFDINRVQTLYQEHRMNLYYAEPVEKMLILQLTQFSLLILFFCIWISLLFARSITKPLNNLIIATNKVTEGNYDISLPKSLSGELGALSVAFSTMAYQIKERQEELKLNNIMLTNMNKQISNDKLYIEAILRNVDAAIILLDNTQKVINANDKADSFIKNYSHIFQNDIVPAAKELASTDKSELPLNIEFDIDNKHFIYVAMLSKLILKDRTNILIVLSDVTDLLDSQKLMLWKTIATNLSHEIKNPLTPISLMAERVKKHCRTITDAKLKEMLKDSMDIIITEVTALKDIVEEFSIFAKPKTLNNEDINISLLCKDILNMYSQSYKFIKFELISPDTQLSISANYSRFKRVIQNIVANAIESIKLKAEKVKPYQGVVTIEVSKISNKIRIEIKDNGIGIEKADLPKLFNPYFSKHPKGTGLGLAIVYSIIEELSGTVEAKNIEDNGSVAGVSFIITLPLNIE